MKKLITKITVLLVTTILLVSCGSKSIEIASVIPKDANLVMVIDQKRMGDKLKQGNFSIDSIWNLLLTSKDSTKIKKVFNELKQDGLNSEDKIVMFMSQAGSAIKKSQTMLFNLVVKIEDVNKFEAFLKNQDALKTESINKNNNYSSLKVKDFGIITWTKDRVIMTLGVNPNRLGTWDPISNKFIPDNNVDFFSILQKNVDRFYNLKDAEKVTSLEPFNKMFDKAADAYMFNSSDAFTSAMGDMPFQLPKLEELMEGNYNVSYINFENGKIASENTSYFNDKITSLMKQYGNGSISVSALENFPAQKTNAAFMMSFKPEMMQGILKELQLETLIDAGISTMGFTLKDLYKCLKGDMNFAMGDFKMESMNMPNATGEMPSMQYMFTASIGDKLSLQKITTKAIEEKMIVVNNGVYTLNPEMPFAKSMYVRIDEKELVICKDENAYKQYQAKAVKTTINKDFLSDANGKSMAMLMDFNSMLNGIAKSTTNKPDAKIIVDKALETFDNFTYTTGHMEGNKLFSNMTVKTKNDKENSLVSIANFLKTVVLQADKLDKIDVTVDEDGNTKKPDSLINKLLD